MTTAERRPDARGFSLVELMVVLLILGLAASAVVLTLPRTASGLDGEASRFAARVAALRDRAVVEGQPLRLWVSASGYGFEVRQGSRWRALADRSLRAADWPSGLTAQWNGAGQGSLVFNRLGMPDRGGRLILSSVDDRRVVRVDSAGNVHVEAAP